MFLCVVSTSFKARENMHFQLCENTGFFLRLGLVGPSGSGKTYTALALATELGFEKIGVIDTENRSARRYARSFGRRFYTLELDHFSPRDYIEAIRAAEAAGIEILIIDSLSHAWIGRGGVLEMVDVSARRQARGGTPNSFSGWREVTPEHNRLVDALVHARMHLVVTMRTKTEYVVEKTEGGKTVPRKVGLAPVQREGLEYEFDIVGDLSTEHELVIGKSRCPTLADRVVARPGAELARELRAWLDGADGTAQAAAPASAEEDEPEAPAERSDGSERAEPAPAPVEGAHDGEAERPAVVGTAGTYDPGRPGRPLPPVRPVMPARTPARTPSETIAEELSVISPWLRRIQEAEEHGSEEQLDAVRTEMNAVLKRRTKAQGEALRRAIETARAAIRAGGGRTASPGQAHADAGTEDERAAG
jgi:DNA polymerase III delta prime subunit